MADSANQYSSRSPSHLSVRIGIADKALYNVSSYRLWLKESLVFLVCFAAASLLYGLISVIHLHVPRQVVNSAYTATGVEALH